MAEAVVSQRSFGPLICMHSARWRSSSRRRAASFRAALSLSSAPARLVHVHGAACRSGGQGWDARRQTENRKVDDHGAAASRGWRGRHRRHSLPLEQGGRVAAPRAFTDESPFAPAPPCAPRSAPRGYGPDARGKKGLPPQGAPAPVGAASSCRRSSTSRVGRANRSRDAPGRGTSSLISGRSWCHVRERCHAQGI